VSITAILLAAGRSRRFGQDDKLMAPLGDRPLLQHAARTLLSVNVDARYIIRAKASPACDGYIAVDNAYPETGLGRSIALGVAAAKRGGARAVLLALADMPFVSTGHLNHLLSRYAGDGTLVASSDGATSMPPALFGADWFEGLQRIAGDFGARGLLRQASLVSASADELLDIDCQDDLDHARKRVAPRIPVITSGGRPSPGLHEVERRA
jgi:molybdenum cofactor cytidylyltransferase